MYKFPPLYALRVFEAVARLGGVRMAAQELCVTPPAVSHQLAKLEEYLESPLFIRKGRTLLLTEVARDYLTEIRPSLLAIGRATAIASQKKNRETLTVAAPPSLTTKWLIPRLARFSEAFPQYDVRLLDRMILAPEEKGIDIAIEYRFEEDPHFTTRLLLNDEVVALTSHEYAHKHDLRSIEDLRGLTLIETERRLNSWKSILADFPWVKDQPFLSVGYSLHAFEAAAQGLGVALGNRINAEGMLESGELCVPFEIDETQLPPLPRYFLSIPPHKERWARVATFVDWLEQELAVETSI
ncbi:LysR substrate-binding domain-containing protein [Marinobacter xestospongiae]|uniref:LysR substrate-binding domain-containing protein n=1 Tax=Marinobacter xestospongiae TaxID=994319 RepID=UPI002002BD14|nr:LysR substrate-binding domain-containing protein [Marinobacter xestospongiae]MCK7568585.1 LysR substrate-binding domain-containing protein [Marinobacter xestospongiae]